MESTLKNMVLTLLTITLISGAAVGGVYILTAEPIAVANAAKVNNAISEVIPGFDNAPGDEATTTTVDGVELKVYPAKKGGETIGYAIETFSDNGFGGRISLIVGFRNDGTINDIAVIGQSETPGLGDKIMKSKSDFGLQFQGKNPESFKLSVKKDGGDIDAITASTISSRAYADAVERAYQIFKTLQ